VGGAEDDIAGSAVREEGRASEDGRTAIHQFRGDRQETGYWERFLFIYLFDIENPTDGIKPGG
jgi:hypothetical protein